MCFIYLFLIIFSLKANERSPTEFISFPLIKYFFQFRNLTKLFIDFILIELFGLIIRELVIP